MTDLEFLEARLISIENELLRMKKNMRDDFASAALTGIEDAHIHDIRAKAATDAKAQGIDGKALLGHTTDTSHNRYVRSKEVPTVQPLKVSNT